MLIPKKSKESAYLLLFIQHLYSALFTNKYALTTLYINIISKSHGSMVATCRRKRGKTKERGYLNNYFLYPPQIA